MHPALSGAIADGSPNRQRCFEAFRSAFEIVRIERHVTEGGQGVRLQLPFAELATQHQAAFEDGASLVRTIQPGQACAEAVQDQGFLTADTVASNQREHGLVTPQCLAIPATFPFQDAEDVLNRRLAGSLPERRRQRQRRL